MDQSQKSDHCLFLAALHFGDSGCFRVWQWKLHCPVCPGSFSTISHLVIQSLCPQGVDLFRARGREWEDTMLTNQGWGPFIFSVLVVLVLRLSWNVIAGFFLFLPSQRKGDNCLFLLFTYWMGLPSSLIIPLLYLKRKEKLFCKKKKWTKTTKGLSFYLSTTFGLCGVWFFIWFSSRRIVADGTSRFCYI